MLNLCVYILVSKKKNTCIKVYWNIFDKKSKSFLIKWINIFSRSEKNYIIDFLLGSFL